MIGQSKISWWRGKARAVLRKSLIVDRLTRLGRWTASYGGCLMIEEELAFVDRFNETIEGCQVFVYMTRDSGLQREACTTLDEQLVSIASEKADAIRRGAEKYANI